MKRKQGRPSTVTKVDQTKVLDIAIKAFARNGFEGTQMKQIADEAGCAKSLINYYFKNKDNLWKESMIHLGGKLMLRFNERANFFKDLEGHTAVKALARQLVYFSAEFPEFHRLISNEMYFQSDRSDWLIDNVLKPIQSKLVQGSQKPDGSNPLLERYPMANLTSILVGATTTFFNHAYQMEKMYGVNPHDKAEIERHADIVIEILFSNFQE